MANSDFRHQVSPPFEGKISQRPRERQLTVGKGEDKTTIHGLEFKLTEEREERTGRDGMIYNADPTYSFSVFKFPEDEESQRLYAMVEDLDIGDTVRIHAAVVPRVRDGWIDMAARVLEIENLGQVTTE